MKTTRTTSTKTTSVFNTKEKSILSKPFDKLKLSELYKVNDIFNRVFNKPKSQDKATIDTFNSLKKLLVIFLVIILASCKKEDTQCDCYEYHQTLQPNSMLPNYGWNHSYSTEPSKDFCDNETNEWVQTSTSTRYKVICN